MKVFNVLPALTAAAVLLLGSPAFAHHLDGTVYQTGPNGVYVNTSNGMTFVPSSAATFRMGNTVVSMPSITTGRQVNADYNNGWTPQYVPQQYYQQHPNWKWNQHVNGWKTDQHQWRQSNGRWMPNR